ncbi:MAG: mechanosensitive ion channel [Chloroflexota bacterium]|nr:mechanosensitive ion channel [Chloroflexota bacterium]MDE2930919.1 mechanosensitive ion channel [Chloroflexota bacterium]
MEALDTLWRVLDVTLFTIDTTNVDIKNIVVLIVILGVTWVVARRVRGAFQARASEDDQPDAPAKYAAGAMVHYLIVIIGSYIGFRTLGFDLDAVLVVLGALGIGIGFGLQSIVNNFVSGLILLAERPIKVGIGDVIEVNGQLGTVEHLGARATTLRKFDHTQAVVPNADLLSSLVINWSLDDRRIRLDFSVHVSYASDTKLVEETLFDIVQNHPAILDDPEPRVFLRTFGDSALDFWVIAWVADLSDRFQTVSDLHHTVCATFQEKGIKVPYPQRTVYVRSENDAEVPARTT